MVVVIPSPAAEAAPPLCDGKPATIVGTSGDDVLRGTDDDDVIAGLAGDDTIKGLDGNDTICGKNGNDTLIGGSGDDVLLGGPGTDRVSFWNAAGSVVIDLADGTGTGDGSDRIAAVENVTGSGYPDEIRGNSAANVLRGGDGDDVLVGKAGEDRIFGGGGNDELRGGNGVDRLWGDDGNDLLHGDLGNDELSGGKGNDTLIGGPGNDRLAGGNGSDWALYGSSDVGVDVDLAEGTATGQGVDQLHSVENVIGSPQQDILRGAGRRNVMRGGGGNDSLLGRAGADTLLGGPGGDLLLGGSGDDTLDGHDGDDGLTGGPGDDLLRGWAGDDTLAPGKGNDTVEGGNGTDLVSYHDSPHPIEVDLPQGAATGNGNDSLAGIEDVTGSNHDDVIVGNFAANRIEGRSKDDVIRAGGGADVVFGGSGRDFLDGGPGTDILDGGYGLDECKRGETITGCWPAMDELAPAAGDRFEGGMAISSELLAIKGETAYGTGPAVFVYERSGSHWVHVTDLTPPPIYPNAGFGGEVAVTHNQVFIGDPAMDTAGAVWVYTRNGEGWNRARAVLAAPPNGERLGHELDSDGERIVAAGLSGEYVEVLTPDGPGWDRDIFHIGGPAVFWGHGDVAVDGDIVVAGFAQDEVAHVLRWTGTRWERDLLNGGASTHFFGDTVQVEGNRIVVGASGHTPGPGGPSSIHLFERFDGTWEGTTVAAAEREGFATNISLSGNTIVAGIWDWDSRVGEGDWYRTPKVFHYRNGSWHDRPLDFPESVEDDVWSPIPVAYSGDRAATLLHFRADGADRLYYFEPPPR